MRSRFNCSRRPGSMLAASALGSAAVFGANGTASAASRAPRSRILGSFRTYRRRAIADINSNPQSISPKSGSGYLPGGDGPPKLRPAHLSKSAELIMAASGAEHDGDRSGFLSNPSRSDARGRTRIQNHCRDQFWSTSARGRRISGPKPPDADVLRRDEI
jgi:hypothetical protein